MSILELTDALCPKKFDHEDGSCTGTFMEENSWRSRKYRASVKKRLDSVSCMVNRISLEMTGAMES